VSYDLALFWLFWTRFGPLAKSRSASGNPVFKFFSVKGNLTRRSGY